MKHLTLTASLLAAVAAAPATQAQTSYGAVGNGGWSDPATWTPAGGPPAAADDASIGTNTPSGSAATATVTLTGATSADEVYLGRGSGTNGTLDLNGNVLNANDLNIGTSGGTGTLVRGGGHIEITDRLTVNGANSFLFEAADLSADLSVTGGASATTAATGNLSTDVDVTGNNSRLNLGADLVLTSDLEVYGSSTAAATVDAQGHDITARSVYMGRIGYQGQILNPGRVTATDDLHISDAAVTLDPAVYSVGDGVYASHGANVTFDPLFSAQRLGVETGSTVTTSATANVNTDVDVTGNNSRLNLGADLVLTSGLEIYGSSTAAATVDAQGHDITARNVYMGRIGYQGQILNPGRVTATDDLHISDAAVTLDPAVYSVGDGVYASHGANVTFDPLFSAQRLGVETGSTVTTSATANVNTDVDVTGNNSRLNLGADLVLTSGLEIYGSSTAAATVDAQGHDITARNVYMGRIGYQGQILNPGRITATDDLHISDAAVTLDPAVYSVGDGVYASYGANVTFDPLFSAQRLGVETGSTVTSSATSNLSTEVDVTGNNSRLNLGADLVLTSDLEVYGSSVAAATVDAQGHDITARNITVGLGGRVGGELLNDGAITAQDLTIQDGSSVLLTGGDDVILDDLVLDDGGLLTVAQSVGELTGLTLDGDSLSIAATSLLTLAFDDRLAAGLDWAFRWANPTGGDRVGTLLDFITDGLIIWSAPWAVAVFDQGDGYTYIGYKDAQVPVPGGLGVVSLLVGSGWLGWRRRR
jgi:hypothetical protein